MSITGLAPDASRPIRRPRWRYVVTDLLSGRRLTQLPLTGVKFDRRISRAGSFEANMAVANRQQAVLADQIAEWVGRLSIWAVRGTQVWWGGVLWTATPSGVGAHGDETIAFQGATFESYAARRIIRKNLTFKQTDQAEVMNALWLDLQSRPEGDIGMQVDVSHKTGILRNRSYLGSDAVSYEQRIEELGDVSRGSEHTIDVSIDSEGGFVKRFRLGTPVQLASHATDDSRLTVSGHRIPAYSRSNDATSGGTSFQSRGATPATGAQQPLMSSVYESTDLLDAGWPLLDVTDDFTTVSDKRVLNAHAKAQQQQYSGQLVIPSYSIYLNEDDDWTPNRIGESINLVHSKHDLWNPGLRTTIRPVVVEVTPGDSDVTKETIDLTIDTGEET